MEFSQYIESLEKKLIGSFDLERNYKLNDYEYDLFAEYHIRNERYMMMKKAVVYAIENNEYCFIKYFDGIDLHGVQEFIDALIQSIDAIVEPCEEHMASIITGVIVLPYKPDTDIIDAIKKFKYHKGFAFGFKGWVDIRLLLVTMENDYIVTNKKGKEVSKVYRI